MERTPARVLRRQRRDQETRTLQCSGIARVLAAECWNIGRAAISRAQAAGDARPRCADDCMIESV